MCQCQSVTTEIVRPSIRYSVHERGEVEAQRHKWIESEKAGRDLGNWAILCWVRDHWNGFLRERWLEHHSRSTATNQSSPPSEQMGRTIGDRLGEPRRASR